METISVLTNLVLASLISYGVINAAARFIVWLGRLDDREVDLWPVQRFHHHQTYTDDELLQQGFTVLDRNKRHAFYREQIRRKAIVLLSNTWPTIWFRRIINHDAVDAEEGGQDVI